jgi:hypothetical protein
MPVRKLGPENVEDSCIAGKKARRAASRDAADVRFPPMSRCRFFQAILVAPDAGSLERRRGVAVEGFPRVLRLVAIQRMICYCRYSSCPLVKLGQMLLTVSCTSRRGTIPRPTILPIYPGDSCVTHPHVRPLDMLLRCGGGGNGKRGAAGPKFLSLLAHHLLELFVKVIICLCDQDYTARAGHIRDLPSPASRTWVHDL